MNYIFRHWRGELSLPVSYWINGILLPITLYVLSASTVAASPWQLRLFGASLGMVGIPIIAVWQLIGIYRSAKPRLGFWPGMARLCVGFGWLRLVGYIVAVVVSINSELHQQHPVVNHPTSPTEQASIGLQYTYSYIQDDKVILHARGEIKQGDAARFPKWITAKIKNEDKILGLSLDSPGGSVREALLLADSVKSTKVPTIVGPGERCVSACFLVFAAGKKRSASKEAHIGVHSLIIKGEGESPNAKGSTLDLARIATAKLSVPPSIVGRMVATPPEKVYWLDRSDLAEMEVQIIDDQPTVPSPVPTSQPAVTRMTRSESSSRYNRDAEARKARLPPSSNLCPPPYRMTVSDGCQK